MSIHSRFLSRQAHATVEACTHWENRSRKQLVMASFGLTSSYQGKSRKSGQVSTLGVPVTSKMTDN